VKWLVEITIGTMLDARARRAIEETLLDWSHEAQRARGLPARALCHARAMLGLARVIASTVLYQVPQLLTSTVWFRAALWLVASFLFFQIWFRPQLPGGVTAPAHVVLSLLLFPAWLLGFGAVALFLAAAWQPRRDRAKTPFLGLAAVSLAVAFVNAGWVMPAANQEFREMAFELHGGKGPLPRGLAELTLPELFAMDSLRKRTDLSRRLAFVAACPVLVILAGQLHGVRRRYCWLAVAIVCLFVFGGLTLGAREPLADWLLPIGASATGFTIGLWRQSRRGTSVARPST
jgi:hypothetical protein